MTLPHWMRYFPIPSTHGWRGYVCWTPLKRHSRNWNHIYKNPMGMQGRNLRNAGSNLEDWKFNKNIDGRINCQPMDKADRRRMYADLFGWRMAARFWIPKPLHSIANPSRRNLSCHSWCNVAAFSFIQKLRKIESRTELQGHRIFFSAGKTGMEKSRLHRKMLCGVVHRDSEHRIVSATIQSTA